MPGSWLKPREKRGLVLGLDLRPHVKKDGTNQPLSLPCSGRSFRRLIHGLLETFIPLIRVGERAASRSSMPALSPGR